MLRWRILVTFAALVGEQRLCEVAGCAEPGWVSSWRTRLGARDGTIRVVGRSVRWPTSNKAVGERDHSVYMKRNGINGIKRSKVQEVVIACRRPRFS